MSAAAFFNAARAYKRELTGKRAIGLSQEDVDILNAATVRRWKPPDARAGARAGEGHNAAVEAETPASGPEIKRETP